MGEELYLVHLRRKDSPHHVHDPEDSEDDQDYPHARKRSRSVGEELYQVHLKRSEGLELEYASEGEKDKKTKGRNNEDMDEAPEDKEYDDKKADEIVETNEGPAQ